MCLYLDSSAARGVLSGKGAGRLRHLSCRVLWLKDLFLGIWRGNSLEGANDPGNIFKHVTNQRQQGYSQSQINLLISALSVLTQLQGCSGAMDAVAAESNFGVVFLFTWTSPEKF